MIDDTELLEVPSYFKEFLKEKLAFGRLVRACQAIQGAPTPKAKNELRLALKAAAKYFPPRGTAND